MKDEEAYYKMLAALMEGILDPNTPIENVEEVGEILKNDPSEIDPDFLKAPSKHLARLAQFERMRPYLKEDTYQILIHQDWGD